MENNKLFMIVIMIAMMVSCFTMGFVVGSYHEREYGRNRGKIIAPFVDVEYEFRI